MQFARFHNVSFSGSFVEKKTFVTSFTVRFIKIVWKTNCISKYFVFHLSDLMIVVNNKTRAQFLPFSSIKDCFHTEDFGFFSQLTMPVLLPNFSRPGLTYNSQKTTSQYLFTFTRMVTQILSQRASCRHNVHKAFVVNASLTASPQ